MAKVVPDLDELELLPQKLTAGEIYLLEALQAALDDEWTIFVQPHLNGLRPDFVIFAEDGGIGVFEVSERDLSLCRVVKDGPNLWEYHWEAYDRTWTDTAECPVKQARRYKQALFEHELPLLGAYRVIDSRIYGYVVPFCYFHNATTEHARGMTGVISDEYDNILGRDFLKPNRLKKILAERNLKHGSIFTEWVRQSGIADRLRNALAYPEEGRIDIRAIREIPFTRKQRELLPNTPGRRRVFGVAGSGKTMLLAHKAVNAAREGKRVLLVCFNITMANYLRDMVVHLARSFGPHYHRQIEIGHFHRLFPQETVNSDARYMREPVEVLLVDEGQDFRREWILTLMRVCASEHHMMFTEDDRQNIYMIDSRERAAIPGITGRPNLLSESFRIPPPIATVANRLMEWRGYRNESGNIEPQTAQLAIFPELVWMNGNREGCLEAVKSDLRRELTGWESHGYQELAVLVCNVQDGRELCALLEEMRIPYHRNFESREEYEALVQRRPHPGDRELFYRELDELRRCYKAGFGMWGGRVKVCTIHSFKGWELKQIFLLFRLDEKQKESGLSLLYTALTRAMERITVYNAEQELLPFGEIIINEGLGTGRM